MAKQNFEEIIETLVSRHSTSLQGNERWIDWDAVYADLLDEGFASHLASSKLDDYIEENGY